MVTIVEVNLVTGERQVVERYHSRDAAVAAIDRMRDERQKGDPRVRGIAGVRRAR